MDKNAIKKFAVWAREELIEKVTAKAIENGIVDGQEMDDKLDNINGEVLSETRKKQRGALIKKIKEEGYVQVMEEVAYTWFNRFIAIRFMEVNGYLPSHVRVFSDENGNFNPQIMTEAIHLDINGIDMEHVLELKSVSKDDELFKYLLKVQCNALNDILPKMFSRLEDYTELLLPDYLLRKGSVIEKLVNEVPEDNFNVNTDHGQIEIIGWMYQYYISAKHEKVVDINNKGPVKKEDIPAATQLFTTNWVVKYIVDNSLGRYWIEHSRNSKLQTELQYYTNSNSRSKDEADISSITFFDPSIGSGHFAIYAFDVFMKIYLELGYSEKEAASSIVRDNIYGLDIDDRAAQLAYFSIMMKARQYDRRFFSKNIQPNINSIPDCNGIDESIIDYFSHGDLELERKIRYLVRKFENAKEVGSLINIEIEGLDRLENRLLEIEEDIDLRKDITLSIIRPLICAAKTLSKKYTIVDTNPPYLNKFEDSLKKYLQDNYTDYASDLFSAFMIRNLDFATSDGYIGFMTPFVWMYIKSYEKLRKTITNTRGIATLVQMEYSAYEEATVPICAFVLTNDKSCTLGDYYDLSKYTGGMEVQGLKVREAISNPSLGYHYIFDKGNFARIEGAPIAFMASEKLLKIFETADKLKEIAEPKVGLQTGNNESFLRLWYEVDKDTIGFGCTDLNEALESEKKWFPYNKGGDFRRWYGNRNYVVNWENDGYEIKHCVNEKGKLKSRPQNVSYYFKPCITWSDITSASFSGRYCEGGFIFDVKGSSGFPKDDNILYVLGFLNSKISQKCIKILNPTITTQVGDMARIPIYYAPEYKQEIDELVKECIEICKKDWDSEETSWDFKLHPLINGYSRIEDAYKCWEEECNKRYIKLKKNEEKLNSIFIDIYGLDDELSPDVLDKDVEASTRHSDKKQIIKGLISYSVGCMFGRYSLDKTGVLLTNERIDENLYNSFVPDKDAIIPICDDEYFDDDIVGRFVKFIETLYGKEYLEDNLKFIANTLGGEGSSREVIRSYFINDFYIDHCSRYSITGSGKRPIYWLFDSGKNNGFKCLVYMHRYKPDTIARIRTDYVHEQQARYRTAIEETSSRIESASGSDKIKLTKKLNTLKAQNDEIHAYEEKIHHLADQMISIDLDDGVKKNYEIFKDVLAKIK